MQKAHVSQRLLSKIVGPRKDIAFCSFLTHVRMYGESLLSFQFPLSTTMQCVFVWLSKTMQCVFVTPLLSSNCLRSTTMQCVL